MRPDLAIILTLLFSALVQAAEKAPDWLQDQAAKNTPSYPAKVPAVVLWNETKVVVADNARVVTTTRKAIKILTLEGRTAAIAAQFYAVGTGKVRDAHAWVISPSGEVFKIGPEDTSDRNIVQGDMYEDMRVRELRGVRKADPGAVFGYEIVSEDQVPFAQFEWHFQERLPVLVSRYTLALPDGWRAHSFTYNHEVISPLIQGTSYTWELKSLPFIDPEPSSPSLVSLEPRIAISYSPPTDARKPARTFESWQDVSRWLTDLSEAQAEPNDAITEKAHAITTNARTDYQRIQLIAAYVQTVRYVSIQMGLGKGGGYRPRSAADTFLKAYGDCKDKATLMRAMLRAVGIKSYLVAINSSDRSYVREDWPSPQQFNHAVVAVAVPPETQSPSLINHPELGPILLFDPTSGVTSVGDLPASEQGSLALLAAGDKGGLIRTPTPPPSFNLVDRQVQAVLTADGMLTAHLHEVVHGQAAAADRMSYYGQPGPVYQKTIETWIARTAAAAVISKVDPRDSLLQGWMSLDVDFRAVAYAQMKSNRLMVFKPTIVNRRQQLSFTEPTRNYPILLNASAWREQVRIKLPPNFKVDEMPDAKKLETPFGVYTASFETKGEELLFTRSWELRAATVPVAQYGAIREFYQRIVAAEQEPVVLIRQ